MTLPQAVYVGAPRARFAWVHAPTAPFNRTAMVVVPPFGYEAVCAHRSLRHLGERAALAGLLAVRIDLDGTGDSQGDETDADRVPAWVASVRDACDLARHRGADRIVLVGVRLGASIACTAAVGRDDVASVVAIAPVPSGKALVREMRMLQGALGLAPPPPGMAGDGTDEAVGFALAPDTVAALTALDLTRPTVRFAPAMLVIDRDDLPAHDAWVERLRDVGIDVEHRRLPGYVDMVVDPHKTTVPEAILAAAVDHAAGRPLVPAAGELPSDVVQAAALVADGFREEPVRLDGGLFAVVTRPNDPSSPRQALVLLNAGAIHRVGPNRLYVRLARRLAARDVLVVRADLSGIGDSPPAEGAADNVTYPPRAVDDAAAIVRWIRRLGIEHVGIAGLCSGAYHALKAAVAGTPVDTVVPINPLTFFRKPGMPLDVSAFRVAAEATRYKGVARSAESWKKLLRGEVHVRFAVGILARRARDVARHHARGLMRRCGMALDDDIGAELLGLAERGVSVRFVFAADDPGRAVLLEQGGSLVAELLRSGRLDIDVIEGPDHTFTARWTHALFLATLERAVFAEAGSRAVDGLVPRRSPVGSPG